MSIDPGKLYDWLEDRSIVIMQLKVTGNHDLTREEWETWFRKYLTDAQGPE